jgi:hypothetical protein
MRGYKHLDACYLDLMEHYSDGDDHLLTSILSEVSKQVIGIKNILVPGKH